MGMMFSPFITVKDVAFTLGTTYGTLLTCKVSNDNGFYMGEEAKEEMLKLISEIEALMPELGSMYLTYDDKKKAKNILERAEAWSSMLDASMA